MFKKYDEIITKCSGTDQEIINYWYEIGCNDAIDVLNKFSQKDWHDLVKKIPSKSNHWKSCMVYSLWNSKDINHLNALLAVINTNDYGLFRMIVNILNARDFNIPQEIKLDMIKKIYKYIKNAPPYDRELFIEYYNKIINDIKFFNSIKTH